jgi:hypothetical protein
VRHHDARRGVIAELRVARLWRGEENLYAPDRRGRALAADGSLAWFVWRSVQLTAGGGVEWGGRWTRARATIRVTSGF